MAMMTSDDLSRLIPITQFNKGQASRIFDRLKTDKQLIVLKNNVPSAVLLSPEEYSRLIEATEDYSLLKLAEERVKNSRPQDWIKQEDLLKHFNITEQELEDAPELEIE